MSTILIPALIAVTTMSFLVAALYLHLYFGNKDRLLQLWSAAWGVYSLRFVVQTLMVSHILPPWMVVIQEAATVAGAFLCMAGAKALANRPAASWWRYGAGASLGWVVLAQIMHLPFFWADLPISFFTGLLYAWSGVIILRQVQIHGAGRAVSGYALILWGIHRADYAFLRPVAWFAPWGFLLASVLFLAAAIGILLLYYDKIRAELVQEIQDRSLAQATLAESEKKFRSLFENSPLAIIHFDMIGKITACNENLCNIIDTIPNKIIGLDAKIAIKDETMLSAITQALAGHKSQYEGEYGSPAGGSGIPVRALFAPIISNHGSVIGAIGILEDISERLSAEKEKLKLMARLQQSQKMEAIGTLSGGIAHDFNNILFPIIGFAEMLREDLPQGSPEQEKIIQILGASLRAKELVKQILEFSRQNDQEPKPVRLQSILKEALNLLKSSIPATIGIQTDIDSDCDMVFADPTQLHQIIMNLATNAFHAMQESGGQLKMTLKQTEIDSTPEGFSDLRQGSYAVLKVIDTGIGINKDVMDKIFDPYFTTKETGKGTGLGLSVVMGIVKSCQGDIHVYSEPGKGTEVHVYLPIMKKTAEAYSPDLSEPVQGGTERILLVDDEEMIVKTGKQMLERLGYHVTARTGSIEAFEAFKANPDEFDLILSDMTMPNMTGTQLAEKIKSVKPDIPIIICTGFSDQINEKTSGKLGIQGYVAKPLIKKEVAKVIRKVLNINKNSNDIKKSGSHHVKKTDL